MARKNRMSVYDGIYHVTSRIAHRAMLLKDDSVKDEVLCRIVSVAQFSGVELWAFCIMDNHLHLFVRVPPVPKEYWLDPHDEPVAYAFGMRPPECREPLWSPGGECPRARRPNPCSRRVSHSLPIASARSGAYRCARRPSISESSSMNPSSGRGGGGLSPPGDQRGSRHSGGRMPKA